MKLTKKQASYITDFYNLGELESVKEEKGGLVNYNFLLVTEKGKFIVQFLGGEVNKYKKRTLNLQFKVLDYLKKESFPYNIPTPIKNNKGKIISKVNQKYFWVYEYIEGEIIKSINLKQFKEIAKALAKYHNFVEDLELKNNYNNSSEFDWLLKQYDELKSKIKPSNKTNKLFLDNADFFKNILIKLKNINWDKYKLFPVHRDFGSNNILFKGDKIFGVIDFDDMQIAPPALDLVIAIKRSHYRTGRFTDNKKKIFLKEYQKFRKLSKAEKSLMNYCLIGDDIGAFLWMYKKMKKSINKKYDFMRDIVKEVNDLYKDLK